MTRLPEEISRDPELRSRVEAAVRRACELRHEHIVSVLEVAEDGGRMHIVEAAVTGERLSRVLQAGAFQPPDALAIARQLADALCTAHESGVVHGAVTPASVLLERRTPPKAVLGGFATAAVGWQQAVPTAGLVRYAPPERLAGSEIDARADVFAVGLLLFEMLEGRPFLRGTEAELRTLLLERKEPLLPRFSRIAPTGVPVLVARAVRRAPAQRQQTMAQLRDEIDACLRRLGGQRVAPPVAAAVPPERAPRPRKLIIVDEALEDLDDVTPEGPVAASAPTRATRPVPVVASLPVERTRVVAKWDASPRLARTARTPPAWLGVTRRRARARGLVLAGAAAVVALMGVVLGAALRGWWMRDAPLPSMAPTSEAVALVPAPVPLPIHQDHRTTTPMPARLARRKITAATRAPEVPVPRAAGQPRVQVSDVAYSAVREQRTVTMRVNDGTPVTLHEGESAGPVEVQVITADRVYVRHAGQIFAAKVPN